MARVGWLPLLSSQSPLPTDGALEPGTLSLHLPGSLPCPQLSLVGPKGGASRGGQRGEKERGEEGRGVQALILLCLPEWLWVGTDCTVPPFLRSFLHSPSSQLSGLGAPPLPPPLGQGGEGSEW